MRNKTLLTIFFLVLPLGVIAQCEPSSTGTLLTDFASWVYSFFGEKTLKAFGVLYGISLVFKLLDLLFTKFVLVTSWKWDDEFMAKLTSHWSYRFLAFTADVFLRLKLPGKKK